MLSSRRPNQLSFAASFGWLALCLAGCRGAPVYQASRLPPELIAPRVGSLYDVDLSRISRSVGNSDILYAGDVVQVTITTGVEEDSPEGWDLRIDENGNCEIPLVGAVRLAGLRISDAEQIIRSESIRRGKFVQPNVSVLVTTRRSHRVTVVGAVTTPGTYELPAYQADLLGALMMAEGLSEEAGTVIEIRHPPGVPAGPTPATRGMQLTSHQTGGPTHLGPHAVSVDLEEATRSGGGDYRLFDGSTVMVRKKPKRFVHVIGLVNRADQFEIPEESELRLLDALALAGGLKLEIADKVHVIRQDPNQGEPVVIEASIRKAKSDGVSNIRLAANDVVSVEETPTTFVVGTIRDFVRFGFTSGIPGL